MADQNMNICLIQSKTCRLTVRQTCAQRQNFLYYLLSTEQDILIYGILEHECLPNIEQDMLIGDQYMLIDCSSSNISLLISDQDLFWSAQIQSNILFIYNNSDHDFLLGSEQHLLIQDCSAQEYQLISEHPHLIHDRSEQYSR